jgi:flagellar basal body-associated protein FliL
MKKIIIIVAVALVVVAAAVYFIFLQPPPKPETSYYTPGDYFVTNIKDSTRLLKVTIVLEVSTTKTTEVTDYLTENNHVIRDIILATLRNKTEDELRVTTAQDSLRTEIINNLNQQMGVDYLTTLYFNDYVIQ